MEAMRGSTRTVALSCRQGCDTCNGSGAAPGTGWTMYSLWPSLELHVSTPFLPSMSRCMECAAHDVSEW